MALSACDAPLDRPTAPTQSENQSPLTALTCSGSCPESGDPINASDPGYVSYQTPGPGSRGGYEPTAIGGAFAEPTFVHARATGIVTKTFANSWVWPVAVRGTASFPLDPNGRVWGSAYQCVGNLEITYIKPSGAPSINAFCTRNSTNLIDSPLRTPFDTTFVIDGSNGTARRLNSIDTGPNCGYASYPECFDWAGAQTIELVPYRKTLRVNADRDSVTYGDSVTFAVSATGGAVTLRSWRWSATSGGLTQVPCSLTATTCKFAPHTTGRLYVVGKVGNNPFVEQARSVLIQVSKRPELECESPTAWGGAINCKVRNAKEGRDYVWRFNADPGLQVDKVGDTLWVGPGVISGKVTLSFVFGDNVPGTDSAMVVVPRRTGWTWADSVLNARGAPGTPGQLDDCFEDSSVKGLTAPLNCLALGPTRVVSRTSGGLNNNNGVKFDTVATGPNQRFWYVKSGHAATYLLMQVSKRWRSEFLRVPVTAELCAGDTTTLRNMFDVNTLAACQGEGVTTFTAMVNTVWLHEQRHADTVRVAALEPGNDVHTLWEPLVRSTEANLLLAVRDEYNAANSRLYDRSKRLDSPGFYQPKTFGFWEYVFSWSFTAISIRK